MATPHDHEDQILVEKVQALETAHRHSLGSRTLAVYLNRDSEVNSLIHNNIGRKRITRLMSEAEIVCRVRIKKRNWLKKQDEVVKANIVNQQFHQNDVPDDVWLTDFTDLKYGEYGHEHHVRFGGVLDVHTGYLMSYYVSNTETRDAATKAIELALKKAGDVHPIVHSDRGSAFTSYGYNEFLDVHGLIHSMSRPGTPYDNSPMERWWNEFKTTWLPTHNKPKTLEQLKRLIINAVHYFNYERRTTLRGGLTPAEYREQQLAKSSVA